MHRYRHRKPIPGRAHPPSRTSRLNETRRLSINRNGGGKARGRRMIARQLPRAIAGSVDVIAPVDDNVLVLRPHVEVLQCDVGQGDDVAPADDDGSAGDAVVHCSRPVSEYEV